MGNARRRKCQKETTTTFPKVRCIAPPRPPLWRMSGAQVLSSCMNLSIRNEQMFTTVASGGWGAPPPRPPWKPNCVAQRSLPIHVFRSEARLLVPSEIRTALPEVQ